MSILLPFYYDMCLSFVIITYFFFFNDTATTEIYTYRHTLSLHDALPISIPDGTFPGAGCVAGQGLHGRPQRQPGVSENGAQLQSERGHGGDRKSTRLNSSH